METKKHHHANLERKRTAWLLMGLICATAATLMAFEYTSYTESNSLGCPSVVILEPIEEDPIPVVIEKKKKIVPPKPKVKIDINNIKLVEDTATIEVVDTKPIEPLPIDSTIYSTLPDETIIEEPIENWADQMPQFPGGEQALMQFLGERIKYPQMAIDGSITGTVYLSFVVDKFGNVSQVEVLKGLPAGCTEEALRVVKLMPNWEPGRLNGKLVKVRYNLPIKFKLR